MLWGRTAAAGRAAMSARTDARPTGDCRSRCRPVNAGQRFATSEYYDHSWSDARSADPVRYVTNHSSGKMGFAIAAAAAARGANVTLVAGPVSLPTPAGVTRIDVTSALEMEKRSWRKLRGRTFLLAAQPWQTTARWKLRRKNQKQGDEITLKMIKTLISSPA